MTSLILLLFTASTTASSPSFTSPQDIYCAGERIDVGTYASPCIADWDADGDQDLVVGYKDGTLKIFYMSLTYIHESESPVPPEPADLFIYGSAMNGEYTLSFTPGITTAATWRIFDLTGHLVREFDILAEAGVQSLVFFDGISSSDARLPNGLYASQFISESMRETTTMVIAR